jgi:PAN domain
VGWLIVILATVAPWQAGRAQVGYDRPGGDYRSFSIRSGDPAQCAARCERDSRCRAWTFSYPRTERTAATCWLKSRVTRPAPDSCCISGIRGASMVGPSIGAIEFAIDRHGGDYRRFEIKPDPEGASCAAACKADKRCRAWTYVRPGYSGAAAHCHLKSRIPRPRPKPCCISGVVR